VNSAQESLVLGDVTHPFKVAELTVHLVGIVVGHPGDLTEEVALEVQRQDSPLLAAGEAQTVDGAPPQQ
jgi:hypothetical protein